MDAGFLDTLVKLASIGASGICIFAIFWIGWLIKSPRDNATTEDHRTLRYYMVTCIFIAIVSAGSGIANAMINANVNAKLQAQNRTISEQNASLTSQARILEAEVKEYKPYQERYAILQREFEALESEVRINPGYLAEQDFKNLNELKKRLSGMDTT